MVVRRAGDAMLLVEFEAVIDPLVNQRAIDMAVRLVERDLPGVRDVVPGFAYLGRVDRLIAAPRHRVPRERVPAGSVGIAGEQTGVYPLATPGGWQLIGRTATSMFDPARAHPSLLAPGDAVRFVPV